MYTRVISRGRITIPIELRCKLGIMPGTKLIVREVDDQIVVMTVESYVRSLRGKYKGKKLLKALLAERKFESEL